MDKDIKDLLNEESKNNMPDLWDKIESRLEDKKKRNYKMFLAVAASIAVIFTAVVIGENYLNENEQIASEKDIQQDVFIEGAEGNIKNDELVIEDSLYYEGVKEYDMADKIETLEDLDMQKIIEGKIVLGLGNQYSYAVDQNSVDYAAEAESIVYGKVSEVKSYVKFGNMILSDMTIEVIKDYKGVFREGDSFVMGGNHGGELSYEEFISQANPELVDKRGYNDIEDRSKSIIEIWDGTPVYRVGEYVLVYVKSLDNDEYYRNHQELRQEETYDYYGIKKLYVNPNTKDVFNYTYDYENEKLIKEKVTTLERLENLN